MVRALLEARPDLRLSVSVTTRAPRPEERDGVHYRFVTEREFDALIAEGAFLEWAEVFGARYGTVALDVEEARAAGDDVILEIDVQGAAAVRERVADAVLIFLQPPSEEELIRRLEDRGTEAGAALERRKAAARREMAEASWFDHVVVNDRISRAVEEVLAIIESASKEDPP